MPRPNQAQRERRRGESNIDRGASARVCHGGLRLSLWSSREAFGILDRL